jgi:hypothetical protein
MLKIAYTYEGAPGEDRELFIEPILFFMDNPNAMYPVPDLSLLVSSKNIAPPCGLFVADESVCFPLRIAGTLFIGKLPSINRLGIIDFNHKEVDYRLLISVFETHNRKFGQRCDFVVTSLIPHKDPANLFALGPPKGEVSIDSLKELLSFGLDITEEAAFNSEGGFTLKQLNKPKKAKKRKKLSPELERLDVSVDTQGILNAFRHTEQSKKKEPDPSWQNVLSNFRDVP